MKKMAWFLMVICAMSCGSAWADLSLIDSWVVGGPSTTPWGEISGHFQDGTIEAGTPAKFEYYRDFGRIDTSPLSKQIQYDMDKDGEAESSAGSEIGRAHV